MSFTIRKVNRADLKDLVEMCKEHAEYEGSSYCRMNKAEMLHGALFKQDLGLNCIVVEQDSGLIGYACYIKQFSSWDVEHYLYLDCLFLRPVARGAGVGKSVMSYIHQEAVRLNCKEVQWQTPNDNVDAIGFYERLGANAKGKQRFFWAVRPPT